MAPGLASSICQRGEHSLRSGPPREGHSAGRPPPCRSCSGSRPLPEPTGLPSLAGCPAARNTATAQESHRGRPLPSTPGQEESRVTPGGSVPQAGGSEAAWATAQRGGHGLGLWDDRVPVPLVRGGIQGSSCFCLFPFHFHQLEPKHPSGRDLPEAWCHRPCLSQVAGTPMPHLGLRMPLRVHLPSLPLRKRTVRARGKGLAQGHPHRPPGFGPEPCHLSRQPP